MDVIVAGSLGRAFRGRTERAYHELALRQHLAERERRERREELDSDAAELMDFALAIVSAADMDEFREELDSYDAATIAALQDNERDLMLVRQRLDEMLGRAHVLPDGRRVFKTEDGQRVFDENGNELATEEIHPDEIDDSKPRWEQYRAELEAFKALERERVELIDYQAKLDEARERLDRGEMSQEEFDGLRDDLKASMPEAVSAHVPGMEKTDRAASTEPAQAEELDLAADAVPSLAPKI